MGRGRVPVKQRRKCVTLEFPHVLGHMMAFLTHSLLICHMTASFLGTSMTGDSPVLKAVTFRRADNMNSNTREPGQMPYLLRRLETSISHVEGQGTANLN